MSHKFNTLYDFDNLNNNIDNNNDIEEIKTKIKEKEEISDLTKNFIRNALNDKLKNNFEENKIKLNPSNFSINNQNLYTMFKLEYTLIEDFLIRTKLNFTRNIFNNEMKSILNPLLPLDDGELASLLGINLNELSAVRFKWNKSQNSEDIICSSYLYHILNMHTKIMKIDSECQTGNEYHVADEIIMTKDNLENILKKLDEKYENKKKEKNDFFALEKKFSKYKEEMEERYEIELKNEIERFKTVELSQMRIEENKKYLKRIEKLKEVYQDEFNKKYDEIKKLKNELQERETNLYKEFEERNQKLKKNYEEKEKILEEKKQFLEKKYKTEKNENSIQMNKFNEELEDLKKSFYKKEKDKKINEIKENKELNPLINSEINNLRNQIEEIKNSLLKKNNYINDEDKTKINFENNKKSIKPSKKSVITNLELFAKNNNNNNINITKSSYSHSGSGAYNSNNNSNTNNKMNYKKERMKMIEKIEEEEYQLNNKFKEEFMKIIHDESPIIFSDKVRAMQRSNENNEIKISYYKPKEIESLNKNNKNIDNNEIKNKNENIRNNNNIEIKLNNINNKNENENINNKEEKKENNENNIGGFNIGGYNFNNINNNNNLYNYPIKGESESAIEENIEGGENINSMNQRKENNISKKNNFINSNKYKDQTNPIKEEFEGESGGSNNNSKDIINTNKNINNNINVNKSNNKFNNFDIGEFEINNDSKNDEVKNEGEINEEIINYGISGGIDDLSGKRKDKDNKIISASISGIAKKQYEISESAGGFRGLLQMQGHGPNFKDEKDEFEFSKGKNNNNNLNQKTESGKISEEIESEGPF